MRNILFIILFIISNKIYLQNNINTIGLGLKEPLDAIILFDGTREINQIYDEICSIITK